MFRSVTKTISAKGSKLNIEGLTKQFDPVCILDSNADHRSEKHTSFDQLIALGSLNEILLNSEKDPLERLQAFFEKEKSWKFGYLSYDLKNSLENVHSENADGLQFPLVHFFVPKFVVKLEQDRAQFYYNDEHCTEKEVDELSDLLFSQENQKNTEFPQPIVQQKLEKPEYITALKSLQKHIHRGDIYEVNFCMEFFAENAIIDPVAVYEKLNSISKAPFSAFYKNKEYHLLSSSPERFLKKTGNTLISQPIKGTIARSLDPGEDEKLKSTLKNSIKEQTENVMIVDLVRNDLSRLAKKGTVNVDELFGVYSFLQVHQMISTISCELKENTSFTDIIRAGFPMGSMTGAPKLSAMQLIEQYETTKRGVYSGAVGYIDPEGNFDLSVIIRSILYNRKNKYLSFMAGSAITAKAEPEKEYEECLLKARAMTEALTSAKY